MDKFKNITELLEDDSFVRWVKGDSNPEETRKWEAWESSSDKNQELYAEAKFIIESLGEMEPEAPDPTVYLERFLNRMENSRTQKQLWNFREYNRRTLPRYVAIAASILIMIVAGIAIYNVRFTSQSQKSPKHEVAKVQNFKTNYGQKKRLTLSDGSKIVLNANSQLRFADAIGVNNKIDVWLNGEAYFEIKHLTGNAKRAFVVHTKDGTITDIGTRFSVNTRSDSTTVALVQGAVNIKIDSKKSSTNQSGYLMKPGELALFEKGGQDITIHQVNSAVYTSWISNKLTFDHTPIKAAARRIEDTYGVKVVINDKNLLKKSISGSVRNNNLNVLIDALSKMLRVPVRKEKGKVIIG